MLSAGTARLRSETQPLAQGLAGALSWSRLTGLLDIRRLLPTLGPRIIGLAGDQASEEFKAGVAGALETVRRQDAFLRLIAGRVIDSLAAAGVRSSALKGPCLGESLYGEAGRRPSADIDLLVAKEKLREAVEVVQGLGYAVPSEYGENGGLPLLHFSLAHERGELPPVELHWRIHWYESRFAQDRLLAPSNAQALSWRPAPVDELAALLLFYARDGFMSLRHAADLGAWWDAYGTRLPAGALGDLISAYPALGPALLAAVKAAERTVGLPAGQITERTARLGARGRIAVRLADPFPPGGEAQIYAEMGLIDGLLTPLGGLGDFFKRQIAPPRKIAGAHLQTAESRRGSSAIGHSVRVVARYGLAMARMMGASMALRSSSPP